MLTRRHRLTVECHIGLMPTLRGYCRRSAMNCAGIRCCSKETLYRLFAFKSLSIIVAVSLSFNAKLRGYCRRERNELRYYEPEAARKRVNCVSPKDVGFRAFFQYPMRLGNRTYRVWVLKILLKNRKLNGSGMTVSSV